MVSSNFKEPEFREIIRLMPLTTSGKPRLKD